MARDVVGLALLGSIDAFIKGKQMKTTPWFDMSVKPARDGVYELLLKNKGLICYARFWRGFWRRTMWRRDLAAIQRSHSIGVMLGDVKAWRGLAEKPE